MRARAATVGISLIILGSLGLAFGGGLVAGGSNWGMVGGFGPGGVLGMMGTGYGGSIGARLVDERSLHRVVRQGEGGAIFDRNTNTVTYEGSTVTLVALASPHGEPNMTWEIDGLVNPTVVVRPGAQVTVRLVNTDWGYMHGFELTQTPPPYPFMAMMGISNIFLLMPLPERTSKNLTAAQYYTTSGTFTAVPGTYYYLCPVPGHAEQGMYGKLVVG